MRFAPIGFLFLALTICARASDDVARGWVHVNGYTYHMVARDCNDLLLGTGITWYTRYSDRLRTAWEADAFADSARKLSLYGGYSVGFPIGPVTLGATGAVMYHHNFIRENRYRTLPVAFPFLETGTRKFKVRVYYVPPVRRASDEQVAVQLLLPVWK